LTGCLPAADNERQLASRKFAVPVTPQHNPSCGCFVTPYDSLTEVKDLGMDERGAKVSLWLCRVCGRWWLRYFYEVEAFSRSGRWYLGAVTAGQAAVMVADQAKATFEGLGWYYYGGTYFGGESGRTQGAIRLNP
jgi:hypothetical protein